MVGAGAGLVLGLSLGGCPSGAFNCTHDSQCEGVGASGQCEANGYCSFSDDTCPGGRRYGEHAGIEFADECVEPDVLSGSGDGIGESAGVEPSAGTSGPDTAGGDTEGSSGPDSQTTGVLADFVFTDDQWPEEFGAGSVEGLVWDGSAVRLDPDASDGSLISRPFDAEQWVTWTSLTWWARAPYGKPLPDGGAAEQGYAEDGVDMQGNQLLLHLDMPQGALRSGAVVIDASGTGHDALLEGDAGRGVSGRFGTAVDFDANTRVLVDPAEFGPGEGDFSWAVWVRLAGDCSGAHAFVGFDSASSDDSANIWLACLTASSFGDCPGGEGGRAVFVVSATQGPSGGGSTCGSTNIDDGQWHHVVATKKGHSPATLRTYIDGRLDDETTATIDGPLTFPDDVELSIGAHPGNTYPLTGTLDEVAIWNRALDADEVAAMYRRGVLRLEIDVRSCGEPTCDDPEPFEGPGGGTVPFMDPASALVAGTMHPLAIDGRVFQYRAHLSTFVPGMSPGLEAVTVTGALP